MGEHVEYFPLKRDMLCGLIIFAAFFFLVYRSTVLQQAHYCRSDPHGTLLTAQSLLEYGTIKLDAYHLQDLNRPKQVFLHAIGALQTEVPDTILTLHMWQMRRHNDHIYHMFPVGTAFVALPAVAVAYYGLGADMTVSTVNWAFQRFLAAFSVGLIAAVCFFLARRYIGTRASFMLTVLFVGGSSLSSACGTALWSLNFQILFILVVLHLLLALIHVDRSNFRLACLMGIVSFLAYLCRPTTLTCVGAIGFLLLFKQRFADFSMFLLAFSICFAVFMVFSYQEYRLLLPPYYAFSRITDSGNFLDALAGLLISPSRGLFVFSPFLVISVIGAIVHFKREKALILFACAWITAHIIMVSSMFHWWGGYSYGPRLLTDCAPAFFLITVLFFSGTPGKTKTLLSSAFWVTVSIAVWMHSVQGLYTPATYWWNVYPNIDQNPDLIWDWRYPQFLASEQNLKTRIAKHDTRSESVIL